MLPKAISQVQVYVDPATSLRSARNECMLAIWIKLFQDHIRSMSYMAEMAKVDLSIFKNT